MPPTDLTPAQIAELRALMERNATERCSCCNRLLADCPDALSQIRAKINEREASVLLRNLAPDLLRAAEERDNAKTYATQLCVSMAKAFPAVPEWKPLDDLMGVLSQIDNMWCGYKERLDAAREKGSR